jgi:hypothetical protein
MIGEVPHGIFIDSNNTIFVAAHTINQIVIWSEGSIDPVQNLSATLSYYTTLFVTIDGDIYFENVDKQGRVDKWPKNSTSSMLIKDFEQGCYGLFIDINNSLYCSAHVENKVISVSLIDTTEASVIVAGNGSKGSASHLLSSPWGIFVNTNLDLYVADAANNRIQLFRHGQLNGTTVAGKGVPANLNLDHPTDVILDKDGNLFIVENNNHRIIRSGFGEFQCLIGCSKKAGSASNELNKPISIRFDNYGNLYVTDEFNNRIQKFIIATNACGESTSKKIDLFKIIHHHFFTGFFSSDCHPSTIKLLPNAPVLSTPIQFRRNQDLYISSNIESNCKNSSSISTVWAILSCSSTCSNRAQVDALVDTESNDLFLPARSLAYGTYELKLTATINTSSSVYIEIIQSNIITNLIPFDTSVLTHDIQQNLVLNPGKYSIDLNAITFNSSVSD